MGRESSTEDPPWADGPDHGPATYRSFTQSIAADLAEKSRSQLYPERGVSQPDVDGRRLRFGRLVGGGAFSDVFEADHIPGPGFDPARKERVAVKVLKVEGREQEREVVDFVREVQIMRDLPERSYFVKYLGAGSLDAWNPDMKHRSLFVMMEYMNQGTLGDLLVRQMARPRRPLYTKEQAIQWLIQIARALNALHSATPKILHRDVKAENILLTEEAPGEIVAKLGDFGLHTCVAKIPGHSRGVPVVPNQIIWAKEDGTLSPKCQILLPKNVEAQEDEPYEARGTSWASDASTRGLTSEEVNYRLTTRVGSYMYMAPEVYLEEMYSEKADVFSFGMIMYELLSSRLMLVVYSKLMEERGDKLGVREYARRVSRGWRPSIRVRLVEPLKALIAECWSPDAALRPSMGDVIVRLEDALEQGGIVEEGEEEEEEVGTLSSLARRLMGWLASLWTTRRNLTFPCGGNALGSAAPLKQGLRRPDLEVIST
ncbi:unnamed protein product [Ostreobium quekettii]|uniref:Protein kinase domain-containing protein n=1 Tax=Ostreobium quekettii TaxID=121088 RepID=A0A8S1IYD0_9CHLO|nr:unnamed protein product [Ostreobium quekettii]|eukprot:evm.model.scf_606.4 EVM.evm.TU.scf_606.4   scf_606:30156-38730(+)